MKKFFKPSKRFASLLLAGVFAVTALVSAFPQTVYAAGCYGSNAPSNYDCRLINDGCPGATSGIPRDKSADLMCAWNTSFPDVWNCSVDKGHSCVMFNGANDSPNNHTHMSGTGSGNASGAAPTGTGGYTACPGAAGVAPGYDCTKIPNPCPGFQHAIGPVATPDPNTSVICPFKPADASWQCPLNICAFSDHTTLTMGSQYTAGNVQGTGTGSSNDPAASGGSNAGAQTPDPELDCGTTKTRLDWIICPVVKLVNLTIEGLDNAITSLLEVSPNVTNEKDPNGGQRYYMAWQQFRNIALGIVVIGALIMLIGQALGLEVFDAYTIKKVMPRIVIALIGIALSWEIMKFFVSFTNDLGFGVRSLIYAPFKGLGNDVMIGGGSSALITLLTVGGILALKIGGLATLGGTALLALFLAFMVLVARQIVIALLIMLAPLAIAAYVLPNTQSLWKLWHESFTKALLMFPIIMAFLATGRVFALVAAGPGHTAVGDFVAFFAYIIPYFLIPMTFRFAGGAMRTVGGFANDKSRGAFDRLKKRRGAIMSKNWQDAKSGNYIHGSGALAGRLNRGIQTGTLIGAGKMGVNPRRWRSNVRAARSTRGSVLAAEVEKSEAARQVLGNDDLITAALHGNGTDADARQYLHNLGQRGQELEQNVASIRQAKKEVGKGNFEEYAAVNLAGTGTGYKNGPSDMLETINRVAGSDRAKAGRMLVQARSAAQRAQRADLYGAGMSTAGDLMAQMHAGQISADDVNTIMTDEALNTKSAHEIAASRGGSVQNMMGAMTRRLENAKFQMQKAYESGDPRHIQVAEHNMKRVLAHTAALQEAAGQVSPENSQRIGAILGQTTGRLIDIPETYVDPKDSTTKIRMGADGKPVVKERRQEIWLDRVESMRGDREFQQYKREYGTAREAMGAGAAANAAATGAETQGMPSDH